MSWCPFPPELCYDCKVLGADGLQQVKVNTAASIQVNHINVRNFLSISRKVVKGEIICVIKKKKSSDQAVKGAKWPWFEKEALLQIINK